jgi:hypothetical protein
MEKKYITKYINNNYIIFVPVYYECENEPAWRKYYTGTKKECENMFATVPDYLNATPAENKTNRYYKRLEYNLLMDQGKKGKAAEIKTQYNL